MRVIESYSICEPIKGVCKSRAIWGSSGNMTFPLVYLRKPKHLTEDQFKEIVGQLSLSLPVGYTIETLEESTNG